MRPEHTTAELEAMVKRIESLGLKANVIVGKERTVIAAVGERLARTDSPYTVLFTQLRALATVAPLPLAEPPVRDMDELLETFGPGADGSEPLLKPRPAGPQPIQFHPRRRQDAQAGH